MSVDAVDLSQSIINVTVFFSTLSMLWYQVSVYDLEECQKLRCE